MTPNPFEMIDLTTDVILAYHLCYPGLQIQHGTGAMHHSSGENGCYPHITVDRVSFIAAIMVHKHDTKVYKTCTQLFLLLAYISAEWNHHGRSGRTLSSLTLRHIMQSQHRIDQFWPFFELYSVCGIYLQSLTTKGHRERGRRKEEWVVVDWRAMSGLNM